MLNDQKKKFFKWTFLHCGVFTGMTGLLTSFGGGAPISKTVSCFFIIGKPN